jgi:nucleoside-triphosphatase
MDQISSRTKNILITGLPGVGKTTLIIEIAKALKDFHPAGFYTREISEEGVRKGFELISLDGRKGLLSHTDIDSPYRVGKYRVDIYGFERFLESIPFFEAKVSLLIIDEIGKMECLSEKFKRILKEMLDSQKWVIGTIALKGSGLISEVKNRQDVKLFEMTKKNRHRLLLETLKEVEIEGKWEI